MNRNETLDAAKDAINGDRQQRYGEAGECLGRIAALWNALTGTQQFDAVNVAIMLGLMKVARMRTDATHADNFVDVCGYMALAAELATGDE